MNAIDLLEEWEADETGLRTARVQALRSDLMDATGVYIPHRRSELEGYMTRMKGQITRKLREAAEAEMDADAETPEEEGDPPDEPIEE